MILISRVNAFFQLLNVVFCELYLIIINNFHKLFSMKSWKKYRVKELKFYFLFFGWKKKYKYYNYYDNNYYYYN